MIQVTPHNDSESLASRTPPWRRIQNEFFQRMGGDQQLRHLFELMPGTFFFMKDEKSRMVCASRAIQKRLGVRSEAEVVGRTDYDFFPPSIADNFVRDDRKVMESGRALVNHVEIWYSEQRILDWFVTNKLPVLDTSGRPIGVMGTVHSYEGKKQELLPFSRVSTTIEFIRQHFRRTISIGELAQLSGLSARQLQRAFRDTMGTGIHEFILKTRIESACHVLQTTETPISEIATQHGFCDQSAFTKTFRRLTGVTPARFRKESMAKPSIR
ncbi:HTH-type transcriptional activator Btr [Bremerella volcania]|uniref:HTH-type transcriptional activator Btr n=1 Tax=Bremerella volcania TaxID=2527984 RepID=A0A518CC46_9BACT|nr:AraC family transcriptional regulator [Bremerella volcania]QDU76790.1 HTH-type transcriptional activator Btr [Bremerella volcania]